MLLVVGVRSLAAVVATGLFHCPSCGGDRRYRLRRPRMWVHVFWIPLVPLRVGEDHVECDTCGGGFHRSVLEVPTSQRLAELLSRGTRTAAAYVIVGLLGGPDSGMAVTPASARSGGDDLERAVGVLRRSLGPGFTRDVLVADLAAHREGTDFAVLDQLAGQLTVLGKESLLRGLADLVLAMTRSGEPDWRRLADVAGALGITPVHLHGIVDDAAARARE